MPYIDDETRAMLTLTPARPVTPGELNYKLTRELLDYLARLGHSYTRFNEVIGALECAKLELYRRLLAPYEDKKKDENGDVYP